MLQAERGVSTVIMISIFMKVKWGQATGEDK